MDCRPLMCIYCNHVIKQRYILIVLLHFAMFNVYNLRLVYNLAVNEMTMQPDETDNRDECPEYTYEPVVKDVTIEWENHLESLTLYAFYIGYIISHIPGGWMADKFGARPVMGVCMLIAVATNIFLPMSVKSFGDGSMAVVFLRMVLGFSQGPMVPCISTFIQKWIPPEERGFLGGIAFGGSNLGIVIGGILTGTMIQQSGSWKLPFYIWGLVAVIWFIFFAIWGYSTPNSHPFITDEERDFLETAIISNTVFKVPWLKLAKSPPCWALLAGQFGHGFIILTLFTYLPKYFKDILKLNIQANAIFTALAFLMQWVSTFLFAFLADFLTSRKILSIIVARKLYTTIGAVVPSLFLLLVILVGCHRIAAITFYTLAMFFAGSFFSGMKINVSDISINYGGTIMAIVNSLGSLAGIIGPDLTGYFTKDKTLVSWCKVFLIILGVSVGTSIVYIIFAEARRQDWDYPEEQQ